MNSEYNLIGNIGNITIKWHPVYEYSIWYGNRCLSEHTTLVGAIQEIEESYSDEIHNYEDIPLF